LIGVAENAQLVEDAGVLVVGAELLRFLESTGGARSAGGRVYVITAVKQGVDGVWRHSDCSDSERTRPGRRRRSPAASRRGAEGYCGRCCWRRSRCHRLPHKSWRGRRRR
jgi:hypothetical protein